MRRASGVVVVALVILGAAEVRCNSPYGEQTPVELTDAGLDAADATPDAPRDASGNDGDAAGDASSSCPASAALCDDFERNGEPFDPTRWSNESGTARHVIDTMAGASTSRSFLAEQVASGSMYTLNKNFAGPVKALRCRVRLFVVETGSDFGHPILLSFTGGGASAYELDLIIRPKNDTRDAVLRETGGRDIPLGTIGPGAWYALDIDTSPLKVLVNGIAVPLPASDGGVIGAPFSNARLQIGVVSDANGPNWSLRFDDVACEVR